MNIEKNVQTSKPKRNMVYIWIIILLILTIVGGLSYYIYYSNKKDLIESGKNGNNITFSPVMISGVRIESQTDKVIKNQKEWFDFLSFYNKRNDTASEINVDFTTQDMIIVAMGSQSSGGYSVEISKVIEYDVQIVIYATKSSPGSNCGTISVITYPTKIIAIPKTDKPVKFEISKKIDSC